MVLLQAPVPGTELTVRMLKYGKGEKMAAGHKAMWNRVDINTPAFWPSCQSHAFGCVSLTWIAFVFLTSLCLCS